MRLTTEQITELINRPDVTFSLGDSKGGLREIYTTSALLSLVLYDYEQEDNYENKSRVQEAIVKKLLPVLFGGCEPCFDNGHCWGYPLLCQSFALIKNKASLWALFDDDAHARITVLMEMFMHMWTFGCNKYNNFSTGMSLTGNWKRNGSPNYMLSNEALILYCLAFFGSMEKIGEFCEHPYDEVIAQLQKYNFKNAYRTWTTEGFTLPDGTKAPGARELFGNMQVRRSTPGYHVNAYIKDRFGNITRAGYGKGCVIPFYYRDRDFENPDYTSYPKEVYEHILAKTFSGGLCQDSIKIDVEPNFVTSIADGTSSPCVGLDGMMWEFNNWDRFGTRSSILHCELDFYLIASMIASLKALGTDILTDTNTKARVLVGMEDCLYKMKHGYIGYSMGAIEDSRRVPELAEWIQYWEDNYLA